MIFDKSYDIHQLCLYQRLRETKFYAKKIKIKFKSDDIIFYQMEKKFRTCYLMQENKGLSISYVTLSPTEFYNTKSNVGFSSIIIYSLQGNFYI